MAKQIDLFELDLNAAKGKRDPGTGVDVLTICLSMLLQAAFFKRVKQTVLMLFSSTYLAPPGRHVLLASIFTFKEPAGSYA